MRVIDLSHEIHPEIPVYPGTEPPALLAANTIEEDGFAETKISMFSHTATHMDAPSHILQGGRSLDQFDAGHFWGCATILDVSCISKELIGAEDLAPFERKLQEVDFAVLKTGWFRYWGQERYFQGFPSLAPEAARWLGGFQLKGVAIDAISIDPLDSESLPAHHALLSKNIVIIENLANLDAVSWEYFQFCCLPIKFKDADGSPVRAVAIEGL